MINLLFFSGSSLVGSANWKLAGAAAQLTRHVFTREIEVTVIDLADFELPAYTPSNSVRDSQPMGIDALTAHIAHTDGIFLSSDEYAGTYSALLKNAVGWLTDERYCPELSLRGMPIALCDTSARGIGGLRGQPALNQFLLEIGASVISQHLELGTSSNPFDAGGLLLPKVKSQLLSGCLTKLIELAKLRHIARPTSRASNRGAEKLSSSCAPSPPSVLKT